jgi:putative DNA primase/helicase
LLKNQRISSNYLLQKLQEDQYGDAMIFAEIYKFPQRIVCVDHKSLGQWYIWSVTGIWESVQGSFIQNIIAYHLPKIYESFIMYNLINGMNTDIMKNITNRIKQFRKHTYTEQILKFCKALLYDPEFYDKLNKMDHLFKVSNGVIDLNTGIFRAPQITDYMSFGSSVTWKSLNEPIPNFEKYLQEIFGYDRPELIKYVQKLLGNALRGENQYRKFGIFYGPKGGNGKSKFLEILNKVLGDIYYKTMDRDVLVSAKFRSEGSATGHLADLENVRIGAFSETERSTELAEEQIKRLSGNDNVKCRGLYKDLYTFKAGLLPILITNHVPKINISDNAMKNRIILIPFDYCFKLNPDPNNKYERLMDINLNDKLIPELPGILAWLVRGCLETNKDNLIEPKILNDLFEDTFYSLENHLNDWFNETCILTEGSKLSSMELYNSYKTWVKNHNIQSCSQMKLMTFLKEKGINKKKTNSNNCWEGISFVNTKLLGCHT